MLIHRPSKHLLAKPILHIKYILVINDSVDLIRNKLSHLLLYIYQFEIGVYLIRTLLMTGYCEMSIVVEALNHEEAVSHEVVHAWSWHIVPERLLVSEVIISSFEFHDLIHCHVKYFS